MSIAAHPTQNGGAGFGCKEDDWKEEDCASQVDRAQINRAQVDGA